MVRCEASVRENRYPLWLQRRVPDNFEIEFEMMGKDQPDGNRILW